MWLTIWWGITVIILIVWAAPTFWERYVYPRIEVQAVPLDKVVNLGDHVRFRCRLTNPTRFSCSRLQLTWQLPDQLRVPTEKYEAEVIIETSIPARHTSEVSFTLIAVRRGTAIWRESDIVFTDVFGLRKSYRTVYMEGQTIVRPARNNTHQVIHRFAELLGSLRAHRLYHEDPTALMKIRPYREGDSWKHVSWLSTARSNGLMVKQFGYTTYGNVWIVLNGQMLPRYWVAPEPRHIDLLCERVVQFSEQALRVGLSVGLLSNVRDDTSQIVVEKPRSKKEQFERICTKMGAVTNHPVSSFASLVDMTGHYVKSSDAVVFITSYLDEETAGALQALLRKCKNLFIYYAGMEKAGELRGIPIVYEREAERLDEGGGI